MLTRKVFIVLTLIASALSAPTASKRTGKTLDRFSSMLDVFCARTSCFWGRASLDRATLSCVCPSYQEDLYLNPCQNAQCPAGNEAYYSFLDNNCYCDPVYTAQELEMRGQASQKRSLFPRDAQPTTTSSSVPPAISTFIPPPKKDLTLELIQESLSEQPQKEALIAAVIPYFRDGHISFYIQLQGIVAGLLVMNASASLACGDIGKVDPQPDLLVVPRSVKNGTPTVMVPDCLIIAVGVYERNTITFWVQNENGSIYSVVSTNKVSAIDQIDFGQSPSLSILASTPGRKRDDQVSTHLHHVERRQIYAVECGQPCPFYHMRKVDSSSGYCGCMFNSAAEELRITTRGLDVPTANTATMSAETCAAMSCTNNAGKPARYNPFSRDCWCDTPQYVDINENAWSGH